MALDAARVALAGRQASIVELRNLKFPRGITLEPNTAGVEVLFNLTVERETKDAIEASFTLASTTADGRTDMRINFSGNLTVTLATPSKDALPAGPKGRAETLHANPEAFYDMMAGTGLVYTAPFKGLQTLERRYNFASGTLKKYHEDDTTELTISPATLDSCLQTAFVTISSPGDKAIWTSFLPVVMESVRFNLAICDTKNRARDSLAVDAYMTKATPLTELGAASFTADIEIFNPQGEMEIQVQGLTVGSFSATKPEDDYELYLTTQFDVDPDEEIVSSESINMMQTTNRMLVESCERVAAFYALHASIVSPGRTLSPNPWPAETKLTLDKFIRESPYFLTLDFVRELGKNLPDVLTCMLPAVIDEAHQMAGFQQHVSRVIKQIAHKYPRMNILGLTDPELSLTEHVLAGLNESFVSYRVGFEPEKNLENRVLLDESLRKRISVDKVNLTAESEKGPKYDMVLLAASVIEPQKTATVLQAVNRMMRPGGFLILIDVSRSPLKERIRRCVGLAPKNNAALLSPPDWPDLLDQCGFGYSPVNGHQYYPPGFSLIVRQADCPEKKVLLHPLVDSGPRYPLGSMIIVGGKGTWSLPIVSELHPMLVDRCSSIQTVTSLESLDLATVDAFSAMIILSDLDEPVVTTMTEKRMEALRALFKPEMAILWVTCDARYCPDQAASFGFTRTLAAETPGLVLRMLDLHILDEGVAAPMIAQEFSRLMKHDIIDTADADGSLWINEPEVYFEGGHRLVPRVLPWKEGNDRVNAPRRVVVNTVNTLENVVHVYPAHSEADSGRYELDVQKINVLAEATDTLKMQVDYSTVQAMNIGWIASHLCVGRNLETGKIQVALSESNASYIAVPSTSAISIDNDVLDQPLFLALLARYLAALSIANLAQGQSVLLVEPDMMFYECVKDICWTRHIKLRAYSTKATQCSDTDMGYIHPNCSAREVKGLYEPEGVFIINMLAETSKLSDMFVQTMPSNCQYIAHSTLLDVDAFGKEGDFDDFWNKVVNLALSKADGWKFAEPEMVAIPDLLRSNNPKPFQIADWKAERAVSQIVKPLAGTRLLSPDKTYVLVGLTRDFGQSLCTLFVQQGARHIVLCSRNPPKTQPNWQAELINQGITVKFHPLDVTDYDAVVAFHDHLAATLPAVGGVVNGAMVLRDRVFSQMSLDTMHAVLGPKTVGSANLDAVFTDPAMDFFIMTSSFAAVGGHAGQSNYAAANMYMNGLAAARRRNGLPGSVLNIGVIYGMGFLHRERDGLYDGLEREGYPPISERDIHHMFVEAIVAGWPREGQVYDITTGLSRFDAAEPTLHWHRDPRFSHFTKREDTRAGAGGVEGEAGLRKQSLGELVQEANSREELVDVLVQGFIGRLRAQLRLGEGAVTREHSVVELGVDSLAAVEVRAWAWKALGQDVPVMKILGGATVGEICEDMAGGIMKAREVDAGTGGEAAPAKEG